MPSIDININHAMREAAGAAAAENGMAGGGSSSNYLTSLLNRLDNTLKKLDATITSNMSTKSSVKAKDNSDSLNLMKSLGSNIAASIATAVGVTVARYLNNQANAIMGRASNIGGFAAAAIAGNANQQFGQYASQFVNIEAQRRIANTMATNEGGWGMAGGIAGTVLGGIGGFFAGEAAMPLGGGVFGAYAGATAGGKWGTALGGGIGAAGGKLAGAAQDAQFIQADALAKAALVQRNADAAVAQWKTGFSRFGMRMTDTTLVGSDITGGAAITAPLQAEFMKKYGGSQNFNAIQNQIVPYLTTNPMGGKTGDLNAISQQFLQAGFAVSDFSKLTMQGSQYMALTGKDFKSFANDVSDARYKFGNAYDASTNQTALNLMQLGFQKDQAQTLANQSNYNPGVMSGVSMLANSTYAQFYQRKALGGLLEFDPDRSGAAGQMVDSQGKPVSKAVRDRYLGALAAKMSGKSMPLELAFAEQAGAGTSQLASWLQPFVSESSVSPKVAKMLHQATLGPGQEAAFQSTGTMQALLNNVQTAMITAGSVTLYNSGGFTSAVNQLGNKVGSGLAPSPNGGGYSPTKP
jgi:hypothetical protein